jgi:4-hydroxybenzoate polyprenyltransferase
VDDTVRVESRTPSWRGYLELLRPPNVVTAVADVLAGYAIAGLGNPEALPWLLLATACLYGGGVVLNDVFDRAVDRVERPERPIPSGRVPVAHAALLGGVLLTAGVLAARQATHEAGIIAAIIAGFILLYDGWGKRHALLGPVNMGICRALNLSLGILAVPTTIVRGWPLMGLPLVYIAAVTAVSRGEVHGGKRGIAALALIALGAVLIALVLITLGILGPGHRSFPGLVLTAFLGARVLPPFWSAYQTPEPGTIRRAVKTGVLSLVVLDATIGAAYAGAPYSAMILATAVLAGWLARLFPVT